MDTVLIVTGCNYDYDLYSMGKDGKIHKKLTQKHSLDDIVRGHDWSFMGPVKDY
jgi:hypothetical protein